MSLGYFPASTLPMIAPEIRHRTRWFREPFRVEQCLIVFTVTIDNALE